MFGYHLREDTPGGAAVKILAKAAKVVITRTAFVRFIANRNPLSATAILRKPILAHLRAFGIMTTITTPDLKALRLGDASAWDEAYGWLWPTALAVARLKLEAFLPEDVEDVAIEALEELVEKVKEVERVEGLRPLVASIAHNRAVSRLREAFAKKRGAGRTESLDAAQEQDGREVELENGNTPLENLDESELAALLGQLRRRQVRSESLDMPKASCLRRPFRWAQTSTGR